MTFVLSCVCEYINFKSVFQVVNPLIRFIHMHWELGELAGGRKTLLPCECFSVCESDSLVERQIKVLLSSIFNACINVAKKNVNSSLLVRISLKMKVFWGIC